MKTTKTILFAAALVVVPCVMAVAGGAGGVGFGAQYFDVGLSSANHGFTYITGFGYGTSEGELSGKRVGGFGTAILSMDGTTAGGVGGLLLGQEWLSGPIVAALTLQSGVGGMAYNGGGYMVLFGEVDFEIGVTLLWMQIVGYAGLQGWGNLLPGLPMVSAVAYTPAFGVRIAWGAF